VTNNKLKAGWGWPANSRKAHYFNDSELTSLCGKWMYAGFRDEEDFESSDDCALCRRKLDKEGRKQND
jgi:hypothetical protein